MAPTEGAQADADAAAITVGVAGAGTMGAGIAQLALQAGHRVVLYDVADAYVERGLVTLRAGLERLQAKGKLGPEGVDGVLARLVTTTDVAGMAACGLVVEAAPEDLAIKRELFSGLEGVVADNAILATNTSTLSVASIGAGLRLPGRLCGMHFFNPAALMPLVEVIRGPATEPDVAARVAALASAWGKTPVEAADRPGFIVNRVARPFYGEGLRLLGEGVGTADAIDAALRAGGFPMGPFELMDLIGIDINFAAASSVYEGFFQDPRFRPHPIQRAMVESGRLGRKSGRGYYAYGADGKVVDAAVDASVVPAMGSDVEVTVQRVVLLGAADQPDVAAMAARLEARGIRAVAAGPDAHEERATREADVLIDMEPGWHPARAERLRRYGRWLRDGRPILACTETVSTTALAGALDSLAGPARLTGFTLLPPWGDRATVECFAPLGGDAAARAMATATWSALGFDAVWFGDTVAGVLPRTVACLANEAAFAVMDGTAAEGAVDQAMQLGTRYPRGPLAWAREIGLARTLAILDALAREHGEDRYRAAPLLRRWVEAG